MQKEEQLIITKTDDKISLLDMAASLLPQQKIVFGILASKNKPMTPGEIASEYYSLLSENIILNWQLANALNKIVSFYLGSNDPQARTPQGSHIEEVSDKRLDDLNLTTLKDFSNKLEFVRKATSWLLNKSASKGVVLSIPAIKNVLLSLPTENAKPITPLIRAYISPSFLKEWRTEQQALLTEINNNPLTKFDEELLRFFGLSNYLLSLRLMIVEKPAKSIEEMFVVLKTYPDDRVLNNKNLNSTSKEIDNFIERLSIPKSVLDIHLAIQYVAVPLAEKLDGFVFAQHF